MRFFLGIGNKDLALVAVEKTHKGWMWLALIGINLVYACTYICMKKASPYAFLSAPYILWVAAAFGVMGVYAVLWQQVLKVIPLSVASSNKSMTIVWGIFFGRIFFGEPIKPNMIIGAIIIFVGILILNGDKHD